MSITEKSEAQDSSGQNQQSGQTEHVNVVKRVHADGTVVLLDAKAVGGELEEMPAGYFLSVEFIGTAVCLASICAYVGYVLPATTLSLINADIGPSASINWVATGWTLGSAWGFLLVGRLSDMLGRRWMVLSTTGLGLIGCIVGCTAQNVGALIGGSVLNGIAAAAQLSFGIILGELVPNKHRGPIVALAFLSSLPFAVFGPVISRLFIMKTSAGWRWSYYIGVILSVITIVLYYFFYHPPSYTQLHVEGKTKRQQIKELDFVGIVLFTAGITVFLIGISWGGTTYPWKGAHVVAMIVVGGLTLIAFALYEQYFCKVQPLMPPRLFKNSGFTAIVMIAAIGAMIYYSQTVLWPQVIQRVYTTDEIKVGLQSSVVGGGVLLGQTIAGITISYVPKVKLQTIAASCLACAFIGSLASITGNDHAKIIVLAIIGNASIGFVDNIAFPGVTLVWEAQDIGLATGVLGSLRAIGGAIAQSLYTSIFSTKVAEYMPEYVTPAAIAAGLPKSSIPQLLAASSAGDFSKVPGITPEILTVVTAQVKRTYVDSFSIVFYVTIPFSVLLIVSSLFVPNMEKFLGNNVARRLQGRGIHVGTRAEKPAAAGDNFNSEARPGSGEKRGTEAV